MNLNRKKTRTNEIKIVKKADCYCYGYVDSNFCGLSFESWISGH